MNAISLKLPARLLERLEAESRARGTTKSSLVRECLEQTLGTSALGDVRLSEMHSKSMVLTFDADFKIYGRHDNKVIPVMMP